jgi:hypothetical protein
MDHDFGIFLIGISILMLWLSFSWRWIDSSDKKVEHVCTKCLVTPPSPLMVIVSNNGLNYEQKRKYLEHMETIHRANEIYQERKGQLHPVASVQDQVRIREILAEFEELRWSVMADPLYSEALHAHYVGIMKTLLGERRKPLRLAN